MPVWDYKKGVSEGLEWVVVGEEAWNGLWLVKWLGDWVTKDAVIRKVDEITQGLQNQPVVYVATTG